MHFVFHSINMVHCIDWFPVLNKPCIWGIKSTLSWCVILFILLDLVCWYFLEDFRLYSDKRYWSVVFLWCLCFFVSSNIGLIEWVKESPCLFFFLPLSLQMLFLPFSVTSPFRLLSCIFWYTWWYPTGLWNCLFFFISFSFCSYYWILPVIIKFTVSLFYQI